MASNNAYRNGRMNRRREFLRLLARDLRRSGRWVRVVYRRGGATLQIGREVDAATVIEHLKVMRAAMLRQNVARLSAWERSEIMELLGDARQIDPMKVQPCLVVCDSRRDHRLFRYCQWYQTVPSKGRVGRRMRFCVFDVGQNPPFVMGIIELASAPYSLACRDRLLGWNGSDRKAIKDIGLRMMMDLSTCIAVPPYNVLRVGKLLASIAVSRPVVRVVQARYGAPLRGLLTTSATGIHCPLFNRIMLRPGGLFRRVGQTSGFSTVHLSPETLRAARSFLPFYRSAPTGDFSLSVRPLRILGHALRRCGIRPRHILRTGVPKGVYFAETAPGGIRHLRTGGASRLRGVLNARDVLAYWHSAVLPKALATTEQRMRFASMNRQNILLSSKTDWGHQ